MTKQRQARSSFRNSGLDYLVMGNYVLDKKEMQVRERELPQAVMQELEKTVTIR